MGTGNLIRIESESEPGKAYEVSLADHTCTCTHYAKKLYRLAASDPHRLCKHLVVAMADSNTFEGFEQFRDEILWFAQQKSAYSSREKALNKKRYPPKKAPKEQIPPGSIQTVSREITEQPDIGATPFYLWCDPGVYHHVKGIVQELTVEAVIPERAGLGFYSINGAQAREYYFGEPDSEATDSTDDNEEVRIEVRFEPGPGPRQYRHLKDALFFWLNEEFWRLNTESRKNH